MRNLGATIIVANPPGMVEAGEYDYDGPTLSDIPDGWYYVDECFPDRWPSISDFDPEEDSRKRVMSQVLRRRHSEAM